MASNTSRLVHDLQFLGDKALDIIGRMAPRTVTRAVDDSLLAARMKSAVARRHPDATDILIALAERRWTVAEAMLAGAGIDPAELAQEATMAGAAREDGERGP